MYYNIALNCPKTNSNAQCILLIRISNYLQTREHPYSTIGSIKKTKLTFGVPDEIYVNEKLVVDDKHAPENIYVTAPVRCMAPPAYREVNKDAVYLEKVDYIKFGYPEDNA